MAQIKFIPFFLFITILNHVNGRNLPKIDKNPIILIHGIGGSQIEVTLERDHICQSKSNHPFLIWLNAVYFTPWTLGCFSKLIKFEKNNGHYSPPQYMNTKVPNFGDTSSVEIIGPLLGFGPGRYMKQLVDDLVKLGLKRGQSIRAAPYDFRLGTHQLGEYFDSTAKLIEETYQINGNNRVNLLCHSMGCLRSIHLLNLQSNEWKDKFINRLITIGAPWLGSSQALEALLEGDNFGVKFLDRKLFRIAQRTFPSLLEVLPQPEGFGDRLILKTDDVNYTANQYLDIFRFSDCEECFTNYHDMIRPNISFPRVNITCIYGSGFPTPDYFEYDSLNHFSEINGDGDGAVNLFSLEHCKKWVNLNDNYDVKIVHIPKLQHRDAITKGGQVKKILRAVY